MFSTEEIAFHLLEEVGEVSQAFLDLFTQPMEGDDDPIVTERAKRVAHLPEELADVFAWSVMLHTKLAQEMQTARGIVQLFAEEKQMKKGPLVMFDESIAPLNSVVNLLWAIYGKRGQLKCESCKESPCQPEKDEHAKTRSLLPLGLDERTAQLLLAGSTPKDHVKAAVVVPKLP